MGSNSSSSSSGSLLISSLLRSSNGTAASFRNTDESLRNRNDYGRLKIMSRRIGAYLGVHHYLAMDKIGNRQLVIWERLDHCIDQYVCDLVYGYDCIEIGYYQIKQVNDAVKQTYVGVYSVSNNNCNHWTERVLQKLGKSVTLHGNCAYTDDFGGQIGRLFSGINR